jgi:TonB family protein
MQRESKFAIAGACITFPLWMAGIMLAPPIRPVASPRESVVVALARPPRFVKLPPAHTVQPAYPQCKGVGVRGTVRLWVVIGTDGSVRALDVVSGHPLLISSAVNAVRQWVYSPVLIDGQPVEVESCVDIYFHPR